ncbi:MAG: glycine--tRNA ligase subunit beta [Gammaproteobacteria bacterium]|jgi:glycyl-tRNA synthetase beta chain
MIKKDFLFELLTEELPPKDLYKLSQALENNFIENLGKNKLNYAEIKSFATPRRLAVLIKKLDDAQPQQMIERRGPAVSTAFDQNGKPTKACIGFAQSCGVTPQELTVIKTDKGEWVGFKKEQAGKSIFQIMPEIVKQALKSLPINRPMRWGNSEVEFIRPVHSVILLFDKKIIAAEILGIKASNTTLGHRFLSKDKIKIKYPRDYEKILKKHFVIADFIKRKADIQRQVLHFADKVGGKALMENDLLNEVTALVEWPVGLLANFPEHFLQVPAEILISSICQHQKCFPIKDENNKLLPNFITISNIKSKRPHVVIAGNEKVMNARLSDAEFFYHTDIAQSLVKRVDVLKNIIFQQQLGSLYDKTKRLMVLSAWIAELIGADQQHAERAAYLSKTDLVTEVVGEFPELQGVMGYYYALHDGEPEQVAVAIREQYMPEHANALLPQTLVGQVLASADRVDTLIGIFGINKIPTGDKDPFALRRAASGIVRIIVENKLPLNLWFLLEKSLDLYGDLIKRDNVVEQAFQFIQDRLKSYVLEHGFSAHEFAAVAARNVHETYDFYLRLLALKKFLAMPEAASLAAANKRVSKLLAKEAQQLIAGHVLQQELLTEDDEIKLAQLIAEKREQTQQLALSQDYVALLQDLAELQQPIDNFFDHVMVMVEDKNVCANRLLLLARLRELFLQVADISLIPGSAT